MDLEDNELAMTSVGSQAEELKGTVASLEAMLEESKAQVGLRFVFITVKQFSRGE